jgi:metal-sulfur cluster biosynthetic enzyme
MSNNVSESKIYKSLALVKHPEIQNRNLVELGMIPKVSVHDNRVRVTLALPSLESPIEHSLVETGLPPQYVPVIMLDNWLNLGRLGHNS